MFKVNELINGTNKLDNADKIYKAVSVFYEGHFDDREMASIMVFNHALMPIAWELLSIGGVTGTVIDPKIVFKTVMKYDAATTFALFHNHPSGNLKPSASDISMTQKILEGAKILDITFIDHIILGKNAYNSLRETETIFYQ